MYKKKRVMALLLGLALLLQSLVVFATEEQIENNPVDEAVNSQEGMDTQGSAIKAYTVSLRNQENCILFVNGKAEEGKAKAGETVVVTAQYAKDIYIPTTISVTDKTEQKIGTEQTAPNTYTFVMPESDVAVSAIYERSMLPRISARAAHQVTYYDERYNEGLLRVGYFEVNGTKVAMCVCHEMPPPQVGDSLATVAVHTADNKTNEALRKAYYYGWNGPGDIGASYVETSLAGSVANGHDDNYYGYGAAFLSRIAGLPAAPKGFSVTVISRGGNAVQNLAYWDYNPIGAFELYKTSAIPDTSDYNSAYSLQGAVYGLYSNGTLVARLTTDANGYAKVEKINIGTYQLKEITAPKGFALDTRTYNITINPGTTTTTRVKDYPQSNPVGMLLRKIDAETNQNKPLGSASLANAEFTVRYYEGNYKTDPAAQGISAKRTWVLKTNSSGVAYLSEAHKVSGDPFYYQSNGAVTLPLGTVTITETKAPKGYLINPTVYTRNITATANGEEAVNTYNRPEVPETIIRGDIEIIKFSSSLDDVGSVKQPLGGVEFTITSNTTGQKWVIETNKDGYASTKKLGTNGRGALPYDTYTISETKIPPGHGGMKMDIKNVVITQDNVSLKYIVENTEIFAPIQVVKKDASTGKVITYAGAEFQLLDQDKRVIEMIVSQYPSLIKTDTFVTDKNGSFVFPEMLKHGTYYLKELKAPAGYLPNKELIKITISNMQDWENPVVIEVLDENVMGQIIVNKFEEGTTQGLSNTEFDIYAAEDIQTADGTIRATKGELVDRLVTDAQGTATSKELFLGTYMIKETKQLPGFALSEKEYKVELIYKDDKTPIVTATETIYNTATTLIIHKTQLDTDKDLSGVTFHVWRETEEQEADSDIDSGMTMKEDYITDAEGRIEIKYLQPDSTYCIQETKTLPGYVLDSEIRKIKVDKNGYIEGEAVHTFRMENDITKTVFSKKNLETKEELAGAHVQVELLENGSRTIVEKWVTDGSEHLIENLEVGKQYAFKELVAPKGFELAEEIIFTVENTGVIQRVELFDEYSPPNNSKGVGTGDQTMIGLSILLLLAAGLVVGGVVVYKKEKEY